MVEKQDTKSKRGGARSGAGRPKGGRNRKQAEQIAKATSEGISPLDFLLSLMRDTEQPLAMRSDAAKSAAPYVHARLAAIEHSGKEGGPIELVLKGSDIDG